MHILGARDLSERHSLASLQDFSALTAIREWPADPSIRPHPSILRPRIPYVAGIGFRRMPNFSMFQLTSFFFLNPISASAILREENAEK